MERVVRRRGLCELIDPDVRAALVAAETTGCSGKQFLTGVAAAYEVMERMASEFIPTVMSRGFHAGPVFGIFGAAVAAAKIEGLNADQLNSAIAQCVNLAAGNLEGARSGGRSLREGGAVRNALLAVAMARHGTPGGETTLEGDAGFYHAYTGNNHGDLRYSFTGDNWTDLTNITKDLGRNWIFLETLYRIYSTAGFNIAHVDVTAALCEEHGLTYADIDRIEAVVNWFETEYPSPAFPTPGSDGKARVGATQYFTAYGAVTRGYDAVLVSDAHTTEDAAIPAEQIVTFTNSYWTWHEAPGRTAGTVPTADVSFA